MLSQMRRITDISMSRLLAQLRLHMKVVFSIASSSCQTSTQWFHQRSSSEPRSTIQISINWEEFALISWKTSGLQLFKSDLYFFPFKLWCLFQTWMIHLIRKLPISGNKIKKVPSREPRNGPSNMLLNEHENDKKVVTKYLKPIKGRV